jgi:hypothetical protein
VTEQDRNKAWGFALFCDDVRMEIGGKLSLMGMYNADMFFPGNAPLPILLPKIVIVINYFEIQNSLEEDISFKITYGDALIAEAPALRKDLLIAHAAAPPPTDPDSEDKERIFNIRLPLPIMGFQIDRWARLRVRAHYSDGKILKLGSIGLAQVSETVFQQMMGVVPPKAGA